MRTFLAILALVGMTTSAGAQYVSQLPVCENNMTYQNVKGSGIFSAFILPFMLGIGAMGGATQPGYGCDVASVIGNVPKRVKPSDQ